MRLYLLISMTLIVTHSLFGQEEECREPISQPEKSTNVVTADFLFTYYEQEGNHSAVTGGIGTEELTDIASIIIVNVPLDSTSELSVTAGFNHYSSASTDRIDDAISSASKNDERWQSQIEYTKKNEKGITYILSGGGSWETDYISTSLGYKWIKELNNGNTELSLGGSAFFDHILPIFPEEVRGSNEELIHSDKRRSFDLDITISRIISKRLQASFTSEVVWQNGLLSTTFHRIFFSSDQSTGVERLPGNRLKFPFGFRANYFLNDWLVLRFNYRLYGDTFGIIGNTLNLETSIKAGNYWTFYPTYRFHHQSEAKYFKPIAQHTINSKYFTSDYDLSAFNSHKAGIGFRYSPLYGLSRFRLLKGVTVLKSLELRYMRYYRSDGLKASILSTHLSIMFNQSNTSQPPTSTFQYH